jgi:hypothetical protein
MLPGCGHLRRAEIFAAPELEDYACDVHRCKDLC